jgi:ribulose bisphosphate carboxylase small subunit
MTGVFSDSYVLMQKKQASTKTNTAHTHMATCSHIRLMLETGYAIVCEYQLPEISAFNKITSTIV